MRERPHALGTTVRLKSSPGLVMVIMGIDKESFTYVGYVCRAVQNNAPVDQIIFNAKFFDFELEEINGPLSDGSIDVGSIVCHASNAGLRMAVIAWDEGRRVICRWVNEYDKKLDIIHREFDVFELRNLPEGSIV